MSLLDRARKDWLHITTNKKEFSVDLKLTTPQGDVTAEICGLFTKHHIGIDTDGNLMAAKNAHISFSESQLTEVEYPIRDDDGEVHLDKHRVCVKDSTGNISEYVIREWMPDETLGVILCILGDYE